MSHSAPQRRSARTAALSATLAAAAIALTACGADAAPSGPTSAPAPAADGAESPSGEARAASSVSEGDRVDPTRTTEVSAVTPRILLSHEGGLTLLDAESGEVVREQDVPGFTRLSNAGNGKDVLVTTGNGWEVFSTGIQAKAHGDHVHHYESAPGMTGVTFPGEHPGHVVTHNGRTTLFGDGTGAIRTFDSAHLDKATPDLMPVMTEAETEDPHHGVALELSDGTLFTTQGTEDSRNTLQVIDPKTSEVTAETDDCPGSHGEAAAQPTEAGDVVVMGCENGPVVYRDGEFHKVDVETEYQRSGNLFGLHDSPIVLGDHKVEEEPEEAVERPTAIALIDTRTDELTTVDLGSSYWFRSLGRAEDGSAVVLTYDGEVTVIDEETGEVTAEYPVIEPWKEKDEWQEPGPILKVAGNTAYVTDAEAQKLVAVDLETGETVLEKDLEFAPVEMAVVTGEPESVTPEEGADAESGHDEHADHDHGHESDEHTDHDH
ncbi:PQQ-binding-like beta-propeller repeat protein [Micrococcus luteus]|nr:PQQ-binding-like beta-propeller repeat protein [Micrococcus luteus]MCV7467174.1 PQQ-binding-like beta-propeller repeat protein [Micrococcus luteus]MCV7474020.1 PQQ-binding-like beta-propeller repeat protein [Micrococcus luteus]